MSSNEARLQPGLMRLCKVLARDDARHARAFIEHAQMTEAHAREEPRHLVTLGVGVGVVRGRGRGRGRG